MAHVMEPSSSILYQNQARTVTLIDIPLSISLSQGTPEYPCTDLLYSDRPVEHPHPSIEPRSVKAKQRVQERLPNPLPPFPRDLITQGLAEIRARRPQTFCSERRINQIRLPCHKEDQVPKKTAQLFEESAKQSEIKVPEWGIGAWCEPRGPLTLSTTGEKYEIQRASDLINKVTANFSTRPVIVNVGYPGMEYRVPPYSAFMLSRVGQREALHFSRMASKLLPEPTLSAAPGQFDFILLDPPWENRSARRSKAYASRRQANEDPMRVLETMLGKHIAPDALVACWITNKASVRDAALRAFQSWGVELVEEWAWLKVTAHGEPICDLHGSMRRPYEIVLLGKAVDVTGDEYEASTSPKSTTKRLIVGVPDLHSRKPCLKEIIEPMIKHRLSYRALEIFARNLTAGWWSWGNEVLKYNWKGYWTADDMGDDTDCLSEQRADAVPEVETAGDMDQGIA
ncbi:MAG: hypothetical protein LQ337_001645 [Flavoplaca oasis]|nr:MAG: hypothetical protein LQ337_001645 [Flavoplaca oasis]